MDSLKTELFTDGASRGNPGPAGAGALLISPDGDLLWEGCQYLGEATNNVAEYSALLLGLQQACELQIQSLQVWMDSELIVRQIKGEYKVKKPHLQKFYREAIQLIGKFETFSIGHIPREENSDADYLANQAIDNHH